jgi:hypothetical protein
MEKAHEQEFRSHALDGPLPTVRLAMMREALQDFEARLVILESLAQLYRAAEELSGVRTPARWDEAPQ